MASLLNRWVDTLKKLGRWRTCRLALLLILYLCVEWQLPAQAADHPELSRHIQFFRDSSRQLGISEISVLRPQAWMPAPRSLNFGAGSDSLWLRLELGGLLPPEPYLWLQRSNMEHVCLYRPRATGRPGRAQGWDSQCQGTREPLDQSAMLSPDLVFRLQPGNAIYYLRIDTPNFVMLPLRLESEQRFERSIQLKELVDMLILGALLATLLFNLLLFVRLQKRAYLYYVLFIITNALFLFGFLFGYIRLLPQTWHDLIYSAAYPLTMISTLLMLESLLGFIPFASEDPPVYKLLRGAQLMVGLFLLLSLSHQKGLILSTVLIKSYLIPLLALGALIRSVRRGNRIARLYLVAWSLMVVSGFALALMYQGLLPYQPVITHVLSAAYVISLLLLSLVLAEQLRLANQDKALLLSERLTLTQIHNRELEDSVQRRTAELKSTLDTVDALNQAKNRLFTILAHDLRSPFASLKLMMVMLDRETLDSHQIQTLVPRLRRQIEGIYASLENMLQWARIEMDGISGEAEQLELSGLLDEIRDLYAAAAHQKQIGLELKATGPLEIRVNRHQLHLILRNLVNNAVKFTPAQGRIILSADQQDGEVRIAVEDTGIGMTPEQLATLAAQLPGQGIRNGTEGERGIGLGLPLCRVYLEKMGAKLLIRSQPGQGSVFEICLVTPYGGESEPRRELEKR